MTESQLRAAGYDIFARLGGFDEGYVKVDADEFSDCDRYYFDGQKMRRIADE